MSPSDRVAQLFPQAWDSHFVAYYDSQGYSGCFLTHLHMDTLCVHCCRNVFALLLSSSWQCLNSHVTIFFVAAVLLFHYFTPYITVNLYVTEFQGHILNGDGGGVPSSDTYMADILFF
jgi:hypothetical protein